ncbi:MAG: protein kinase [Planctomycetota bacterium]
MCSGETARPAGRLADPAFGAPLIAETHANPAPPGHGVRPGEKIDHFVVDKQIGAGGSSLVFRAKDSLLNRYVAIKQVLIDSAVDPEAARHAILREAESHKRAAAADPNLLVQFIDLLDDPRGLLLITEYVHGWSLEQRLQGQTRPLGVRDALGLLAGTAKALSAIHGVGVLHRDLKPSNLLLPKAGGLKVADFGLAAAIADQDTMDVGSVRYMAPELLRGDTADARSDLYALGMIAYEMFAGRGAFEQAFRSVLRDRHNRAMRWMKWHTNTRAKATPLRELNPDVPEPVAELVERLMEKEPTRRPNTADDVLAAIRRSLAQDAIGADGPSDSVAGDPRFDNATPTQPAEDTAALPTKSKVPYIVGGVLGAWLLAGAVFLVVVQNQQADAEQAVQAQVEQAFDDARQLGARGQWEPARDAFAALRDAAEPGSEAFLTAEAGYLHAGAWAAFENEDYLLASELAGQYNTHPQSQSDRAARLVREVAPRAAFAEQMASIEAAIVENTSAALDRADQRLRRLRDSGADLLEAEQIELADAESRLRTQRLDLTASAVIAEAQKLLGQNRPDQAIAHLKEKANRREGASQSEVDLLAELERDQALALARGRADLALVEAQRATDRQARIDKLADARAAWQAVVMLSDDPADQDRLDALQAESLFVLALAAEDDGKIDDAIRLMTESDRLAPSPDKTRKLATLEILRQRADEIARGNRLAAQGQFDEARAIFQAVGATAEAERVDGLLARRDGMAAFARGENQQAFDLLQRAQTQGLADDAEITGTLATLTQRLAFDDILGEAEQLREAGRFGDAREAMTRAREQAVTDAEVRRLNDQVLQIDYADWMDQGRQAEQSLRWEDARSFYRRARDTQDTEAVQAAIRRVERQIGDETE